MALKKEEIFRKKPSKEESTYHAAVSLMDAVDCVERFERKVDALRDAAALFESLGDYQDAKQRREDCLERADEVETEGCRKTFALGMKKKKKASTKSDYIDAIEEFRRRDDIPSLGSSAPPGCKKNCFPKYPGCVSPLESLSAFGIPTLQ